MPHWLAPHMSTTGVCEKTHTSREEGPWKVKLSEHQIGGWRAVSAAGLKGKGCEKRNVSFTDTSIIGTAQSTPTPTFGDLSKSSRPICVYKRTS